MSICPVKRGCGCWVRGLAVVCLFWFSWPCRGNALSAQATVSIQPMPFVVGEGGYTGLNCQYKAIDPEVLFSPRALLRRPGPGSEYDAFMSCPP